MDDYPELNPTAGFDTTTIKIGLIDSGSAKMSSRRKEVYINEVGSVMVSTWSKFIVNSRSIIFVVDITNSVQLASSMVEFFNVIYG